MTTYLTVDASFIVKLILPNDQQPHYLAKMASWQVNNYQLCAPMLWAYEVTSVFSKLVHFGQLTEASGQESVQLAFDLGIELFPTDWVQSQKAFVWTRRLLTIAIIWPWRSSWELSVGRPISDW